MLPEMDRTGQPVPYTLTKIKARVLEKRLKKLEAWEKVDKAKAVQPEIKQIEAAAKEQHNFNILPNVLVRERLREFRMQQQPKQFTEKASAQDLLLSKKDAGQAETKLMYTNWIKNKPAFMNNTVMPFPQVRTDATPHQVNPVCECCLLPPGDAGNVIIRVQNEPFATNITWNMHLRCHAFRKHLLEHRGFTQLWTKLQVENNDSGRMIRQFEKAFEWLQLYINQKVGMFVIQTHFLQPIIQTFRKPPRRAL